MPLTKSEIVERLMLVIGCHVPVRDCESCRGYLLAITDQLKDEIAVVCNCGITYAGLSSETLLAHGDLIAAAPDLYASLEHARDALCWTRLHSKISPEWHRQTGIMIKHCDAALAKARGELTASPNQPSGAKEGSQHKPGGSDVQ